MPAGCEFICKNQSCEYFNHGFTITAPWPMGRIELILNAPNVKKYQDFRNKYIELKNQGRKYACITYPNVDQIKTLAYRIQLWSPEVNCIWNFDAEIKDANEPIDVTINTADIPLLCPTTNCKLQDYNETVKNGIICPHCKMRLQQDRWFTNEE